MFVNASGCRSSSTWRRGTTDRRTPGATSSRTGLEVAVVAAEGRPRSVTGPERAALFAPLLDSDRESVRLRSGCTRCRGPRGHRPRRPRSCDWVEEPTQIHAPRCLGGGLRRVRPTTGDTASSHRTTTDRGLALVEASSTGQDGPAWLGPEGKDGPRASCTATSAASRPTTAWCTGTTAGRGRSRIVMRSMRLVCVDIDGKNGGLRWPRRRRLPPSFYLGGRRMGRQRASGLLSDRIGIEQHGHPAVVYHHPRRRWRSTGPQHLSRAREAAAARVGGASASTTARIQHPGEQRRWRY